MCKIYNLPTYSMLNIIIIYWFYHCLLQSWGVRNITLIDNGKVSFSNPVRQSLYRHDHCINSNTYKATAAADVLREIHPEIVCFSEYWCLNILMTFINL